MQDLTFGEQVKIILSRKDMTIKELARKIEARTGKKMSRQNLTQRLGRDNFQERDMRMIAEILGCPFYLNILGDDNPAEKTDNVTEDELKIDKLASQDNAAKGASDDGEPKTPAVAETEAKSDMSAGSGETEEKSVENKPKTAGEPKEKAETEEKAEKAGEPEEKAEKAGETEEKAEKTGDEEGEPKEAESGKTSDTMANERDITIGELVEIHKKLDVLENSTGKTSVSEEYETDAQEWVQKEPEGATAGKEQEEHTKEYAKDVRQDALEYAEYPEYAEYQEYSGQQEFGEEYADERNEEPVEKLLEEIESLEKEEEKEEKQEEKPHGWRAYFKQRFKRFGKEQNAAREEPKANDSEKDFHGTEQAGSTDGIYLEGMSAEDEYAKAGHGELMQDGYAETSYEEITEEEYLSAGYAEGVDAENGYDDVYQEFEYTEESQEELLQEEDIDKGELNPYTGKEYESNSVRMHPSRIGYVQVYDRENHQWTDMTEWAFLGYQERKKQLLGKDYDPPIYLD